MNKEFFEALAMLEKEKGIPMQYLIEKIEASHLHRHQAGRERR